MRLMVLLVLFAVACGKSVDSDGDGLSDRDERERGTDPDMADTDGDGWLDGDEVAAGTDPLDVDAYPYIGGWPINPNKDALGRPAWGQRYASEGTQIPRFLAVDQFGDEVDLYDFAGLDVPVLIEVTIDSCRRCVWMADLLSEQPSPLSNDRLDRLPGLIERGDIYWIRVLATNRSDEHRRWDEAYPLPRSPLLRDSDGKMWRFFDTYWGSTVNPVSWPAILQVEPATMRVQREPTNSLGWISELIVEVDGV